MLIESSKPLTVLLRAGKIHLTPGRPMELSEEDGLKLLVKAKGKVRMIQQQPVDWLTRWRDLAQMTSGLESDDPRLTPILSCLAQCQRSHEAGDLDGFTKGTARVHRFMQFVPGATIRWEGGVDHRLTVLGPATVEHVHHDDGQLHVFVIWKGIERWVSESIITTIEGPA